MPKSRRVGSLTLDAIVDESVRIVRTQGVSGLTMRSVAAGLGVTPMAIYYYVTDKEDLLRLVVGRVSDSFGVLRYDPARTWQETLREYMVNIWQNFRRYPGLSSYFIDQPGLGVTPDRLRRVSPSSKPPASLPPRHAWPGRSPRRTSTAASASTPTSGAAGTSRTSRASRLATTWSSAWTRPSPDSKQSWSDRPGAGPRPARGEGVAPAPLPGAGNTRYDDRGAMGARGAEDLSLVGRKKG